MFIVVYFIILGTCLAIIFSYYRKKDKQYNDNYVSEGMGLGICAGILFSSYFGLALGISLGMIVGLTIGMFIQKKK